MSILIRDHFVAAARQQVQWCKTAARTTVAGGWFTFNVRVLRPLFSCRVKSANDGGFIPWLQKSIRHVYDTSALYVLVAADSTSSGVPELSMEIVNG